MDCSKWGLLFGECVNEVEPMNKSWKAYSNLFHPCQLEYSLIDFDDMLEYTLTKNYIPAMLTIIHTSSLPHGFATWTPDNNVFVQFNINTKIYQGWHPMC